MPLELFGRMLSKDMHFKHTHTHTHRTQPNKQPKKISVDSWSINVLHWDTSRGSVLRIH